MRPQVRTKPDDTRERIMETAEALFRRLGFAKTAVADIAAELGMSPANVYRFFPSKNAIVEAICQRCLSEVEEAAWAIARSKAPAAQRIERLILEILAYHKENLLTEQRVNDIVLVAIEHNWDTYSRTQGRPPQRRRADPARWDRGRRIRGGRPARDGRADHALCRGLHPSSAYRPMPAGWARISRPKPAHRSASCSAPSPPASRSHAAFSPRTNRAHEVTKYDFRQSSHNK